MIVVTAGDRNFAPFLEIAKDKTESLGYSVAAYDLDRRGHFGDWAPASEGWGKSPWKPQVLKAALAEYGDFLAWLDADAFAIRRFDEVVTDDYDIGVTMRRQSERTTTTQPLRWGHINTGVVFVNHTTTAVKFLDWWAELIPQTAHGCCQEAVNSMILEVNDLTQYDQVFLLNGVRIKVFRTDDYNYYYYPTEPGPNTKIVHFKGQTLHRNLARHMYQWANRDWT